MNASHPVIPERALDVGRLAGNAALRTSAILVILGLILFWTAGTIQYWEAWAYLAILSGCTTSVMIYFLKKDPARLDRRMRVKEKERQQKLIMRLSIVLFVVTFLVAGFDRRFDWSSVPVSLVVVADTIIIVGYVLFVWVLRENAHASRIIEVEDGQKLVTSGPYALVRHPMYVSGLLIYVISPLALGSYWALAASLWFVAVFVARILDEERVLNEKLAGYAEYTRSVKYRLLPGIW